jgi:hypothetical protein
VIEPLKELSVGIRFLRRRSSRTLTVQ